MKIEAVNVPTVRDRDAYNFIWCRLMESRPGLCLKIVGEWHAKEPNWVVYSRPLKSLLSSMRKKARYRFRGGSMRFHQRCGFDDSAGGHVVYVWLAPVGENAIPAQIVEDARKRLRGCGADLDLLEAARGGRLRLGWGEGISENHGDFGR